MADDTAPSIEDLLAPYAPRPSLSDRLGDIPPPQGTVLASQPWHDPWIRSTLEQYAPSGKEFADFLTSALNYAPLAMPASRAGNTAARDIGMSHALENKALHAPGAYDWGITGGNPDTVGAYLARSEGRDPAAIWERSSTDLGSRPGVQSIADVGDAVFTGGNRGIFYRGPNKSANENAEGGYAGPFTPETWRSGTLGQMLSRYLYGRGPHYLANRYEAENQPSGMYLDRSYYTNAKDWLADQDRLRGAVMDYLQQRRQQPTKPTLTVIPGGKE